MIKSDEFARRRRQLMRTAGEGAIIVLSAAPERVRNSDVLHPYRQDSDFLYLTGFREPDAMLVLVADGDGGRSILFCREKDRKKEMWDGPMVGLDAAVSEYGMDEAWPIGEVEKRLPDMLQDRVRICHDLGRDPAFDSRLIGWLAEFRGKPRRNFHAPEEIMELGHMVHDMRLYKSRAELTAMRRAARVAADAHICAMQVCKPGINEADIHATLVHAFMSEHCEAAYPPIVGGGANACVLHYIANDQPLADGDLLLIDAGAEYDGYASDITRTFPVNGRYSDEQRAIYDVVQAAQGAAIERVRPGSQWEDIHSAAVEVLTDGLLDLGVLSGDREEALEQGLVDNYYVHKTGHWLGLDVHDVGDYQVDGHSRELEPGMVLTVEPGVYIRADDERVDERWRGIGIRIEDDVAVTRDAPDILTTRVTKDPGEIEALMAG